MLHLVCLSHIEVSAKLLHDNYRSVSFLIGFENDIWFVKGIQLKELRVLPMVLGPA